jgi:GGDEF domain-containing protein
MGILPRERFLARLTAELDQARRVGNALTVAFMKMDLGAAPDQAGALSARAVAVLRRALRQVDLLGRSDDGTFLISLAETDERAGVSTLERLRRAVTEGAGGSRRKLGVSAGVAQFRPARHGAAEELLQEAEAALYAAISEGGDCTATAP